MFSNALLKKFFLSFLLLFYVSALISFGFHLECVLSRLDFQVGSNKRPCLKPLRLLYLSLISPLSCPVNKISVIVGL